LIRAFLIGAVVADLAHRPQWKSRRLQSGQFSLGHRDPGQRADVKAAVWSDLKTGPLKKLDTGLRQQGARR
jgi:hypothetical protein